ncbi:MAG: hypothetical protein M3457_15080 [Chloroflexota bacterium]|nr:hypothetical protein [Chloroflexota bacterium]
MDHEEAGVEIIHGNDEYTTDQLLEQCQGNAASMLLATLHVVTQRGVTVDEWASGVASVFARTWANPQGWRPAPFLDALLTNFRALGARVEAARIDGNEPRATISGYPNTALVDALGVDAAYGDAMFRMGAALASELGLALKWSHDRAAGLVMLDVGWAEHSATGR